MASVCWFGGGNNLAKPTESQEKKMFFPSLDPVTSSLETFPKKGNSNERKGRKRSFTAALLCQPIRAPAKFVTVKPVGEAFGGFAPDLGKRFSLCASVSFPVKWGLIRLLLMGCLGDFKEIISHPDQHGRPWPACFHPSLSQSVPPMASRGSL